MKAYRADIEGHLIEVRQNGFGAEEVLVDGRPVSQRSFIAALSPAPHRFEITGRDEKTLFVEVRRWDASRLGLGRYRMILSVDGVERCRLEPVDEHSPLDCCTNCGYSLRGQRADGDEIRCPECGRHTPARLVGLVCTECGRSLRGEQAVDGVVTCPECGGERAAR